MIADPKLTAPGLAEAVSLRGHILPVHHAPIDLICSSPMRRTLQTTMAMFGDQIITVPLPVATPVPHATIPIVTSSSAVTAVADAPTPAVVATNVSVEHKDAKITITGDTSGKIPLMMVSEAQEIHPIPCDTGSPITKLITWFPTLNFTGLAHDWYSKKGLNSPFHLQQRIAALQERLWHEVVVHSRRHMVLVGHHGIFLKMTGVEFKNCQCVRFVLRHGKLVHHPL